MSAEELLALLEAGDLYGLLLKVGRAWLAKDHPAIGFATLVYDAGDSIPCGRVLILSDAASRQARA